MCGSSLTPAGPRYAARARMLALVSRTRCVRVWRTYGWEHIASGTYGTQEAGTRVPRACGTAAAACSYRVLRRRCMALRVNTGCTKAARDGDALRVVPAYLEPRQLHLH